MRWLASRVATELSHCLIVLKLEDINRIEDTKKKKKKKKKLKKDIYSFFNRYALV
jgi:hypothetical protein